MPWATEVWNIAVMVFGVVRAWVRRPAAYCVAMFVLALAACTSGSRQGPKDGGTAWVFIEPQEGASFPQAQTDTAGAPEGPLPAVAAGAAEMGATVLPAWEGMPPLCERGGDDKVRDIFCHPDGQTVSGFVDLRQRFQGDTNATAYVTTPAVALGLSTALSGRLVSPINPRLILLSDVIIAFQRGLQRVEMAVRNRKTGRLVFYLLDFEQDCSRRLGGCLPGDLFTPELEDGWRKVTLRDDEDLKNTPADCRQCHQRGLAQPMLLMRELQAPWTHFFAPEGLENDVRSRTAGGGALAADYRMAKGEEPLGDVTARVLTTQSVGSYLQAFVDADQPLFFDSPQIADERYPPDTDRGPLRSATWDRAFAAFQRGEQLALPHYDLRPTDPDKQAQLTAAYAAYRAGELPAAELPDLADIFPDDPLLRAEIGLETVPGATPAQVLVQACGTCHNDVLDQTLSRARFNIDLARMSRAELTLAIQRLQAPPEQAAAMPPREARQVRMPVRTALIEYLQQEQWPASDLALLQAAAAHGMAGGSGSGP